MRSRFRRFLGRQDAGSGVFGIKTRQRSGATRLRIAPCAEPSLRCVFSRPRDQIRSPSPDRNPSPWPPNRTSRGTTPGSACGSRRSRPSFRRSRCAWPVFHLKHGNCPASKIAAGTSEFHAGRAARLRFKGDAAMEGRFREPAAT